MKHSDTINELAAALSLAQGQMKPAKMNAVNPFLKNKYADLGAVMDACRDVLAGNGLSFVQMAFTPPLETFGPAVGVETMLMHKSGQWLSEQFVLPVGDEKGKSIMQVAGSAISYARRYALASMLGIVADEDNDGNENPATQRKQEPAPVNRQPAPLPPVKAVPAGINPETGQAIGITLPTGADPHDGLNPPGVKAITPTPLDNAKWELFRGKVSSNPRSTVGSVSSAAAAVGVYRSEQHALNAAKQWRDGLWMETDKPDKSIPLHKDEALELYDWLISRKQADQSPLFADDKTVGYAE